MTVYLCTCCGPIGASILHILAPTCSPISPDNLGIHFNFKIYCSSLHHVFQYLDLTHTHTHIDTPTHARTNACRMHAQPTRVAQSSNLYCQMRMPLHRQQQVATLRSSLEARSRSPGRSRSISVLVPVPSLQSHKCAGEVRSHMLPCLCYVTCTFVNVGWRTAGGQGACPDGGSSGSPPVLPNWGGPREGCCWKGKAPCSLLTEGTRVRGGVYPALLSLSCPS